MAPDKKILQEYISESRDLLTNDDIPISEAVSALNQYKTSAAELIPVKKNGSFSSLKSFLAVFNLNNFADLTILMFTDKSGYRVLENAGNEALFRSFIDLMAQDSRFYVGVEKVKMTGNSFKIFHETMDMGDASYKIITFTESSFFRPTSFHILCDIVMDMIKLIKHRPSQSYYDFFENLSVEINSFFTKTSPIGPGIAYLFTFDQIINFFKNSGLSMILEFSAEIESRLASLFVYRSGIFRLTLSRFLVITDLDGDNEKKFQKCIEKKADFILRGVVLPYACSAVKFGEERNAYSILEKIIKAEIR